MSQKWRREMKKTFTFSEIIAFDNYEIEAVTPGDVMVKTKVTASALNYHHTAHGGYLFALSDQIAGLASVSTGYDAVTQQANIHYLRPGKLGDCLHIHGICLHNGRTTKVVEVTITNQAQKTLSKASFTMFVTGKRQEETGVTQQS